MLILAITALCSVFLMDTVVSFVWLQRFLIGQAVALFAKKHLPELIKSSDHFKAEKYADALVESFAKIDQLLATADGQKELMELVPSHDQTKYVPSRDSAAKRLAGKTGCTACVALVTQTSIFVANIGDSRCVVSKSAKAIELSMDHKPDLENEKKRIEASGGKVIGGRINGGINLSRSFGDLDYKKNDKKLPEEQIIISCPDIKIETIDENTDFLIIACDGVWDCIKSQEAVEYFKGASATSKPPLETIEALFDKVLAPTVHESCKF